ncbi:MAG: hypothetical protein MZU84_08320 [Sphingobacterium sp.]|nr:hypothetical protein [Sphingobacterium sp.]
MIGIAGARTHDPGASALGEIGVRIDRAGRFRASILLPSGRPGVHGFAQDGRQLRAAGGTPGRKSSLRASRAPRNAGRERFLPAFRGAG